jgi:hypothetical protein
VPEGKAKLCGDMYVPDQPLPARAEHDRYLTPRVPCEQAYAMLMKWNPLWRMRHPCLTISKTYRPPYILDPGSGPGIWGKVARNIWPASVIHGVELEDQERPQEYDRYDIGRFPGDHSVSGYDLVVGNPPYNQANVFVEESMKRLRPGGWLMFLLRLQYCTGSRRRDGLYSQYPLFLYAVYSKRISWTEDGKTPPRDHALFIWQKGYTGPTYMDMIGRKDDRALEQWVGEERYDDEKIRFTNRSATDILTPEHIHL